MSKGENPLKELYEVYVASNEEMYEQQAWSSFEELSNLDREVWRRVYCRAAEMLAEKVNDIMNSSKAKNGEQVTVSLTSLDDVNLSEVD